MASAFFLSSGRPGTTWMNDDRTDSRTPTHTRTYHTWTPAKKMRGRRLPPVSPNKWFLTPQRPRKHQLEPTGGRRLPLIFSMGSVRSACACVCVCVCVFEPACRVGWRFGCLLFGAQLSSIQGISGLPPDQKEWLTPTQDFVLTIEIFWNRLFSSSFKYFFLFWAKVLKKRYKIFETLGIDRFQKIPFLSTKPV